MVVPVFDVWGVTWDFERDESDWRARAQTVTVQRVPALGATETSRACLQVAGALKEGWNYAYSDTIEMRERQWYRFSAWVRVDLAGPATPMPYLKCEFVARNNGGMLGMAVTNTYHDVKMGQWQKLSCEFEAPAGIAGGVVALEKGTSNPTEIHAYLDDVTIEPIPKTSVYLQFSLPDTPKSLEEVRGVHPRLYLTDERIKDLRRAVKTTHRRLWSEIENLADKTAGVSPPAYVAASQTDDGQLWQRSVGNAMPYLAMAYRLTGQRRYLDAASQWARASCNYPTWGTGNLDGLNLAAGHQLFGLALVYDWCYHELDSQTRDLIRNTLISRCSAMFEAAATGRVWWHRLYLQNHLWVNICGMGTAGLALFDEVDEALLWVGLPVHKFQTTMNSLGPDGASHEGIGYWEYGAEHMLKFMYLARDLLGIDFYACPWWQNTSQYCLYLSLPRTAWTRSDCVVDLADSPRSHWYGPDHILRHLAATYGDEHAQWLAEQLDTANMEASNAQWLSLLWYDPRVPPSHPRELPTLHQFTDMGIVSARSDWSGEESLVVFKCGPFIGQQAVMEFSEDPGGGHAHPDAGHFVVFGNGEWLVRDDGYQTKSTRQHNTLLVDGTGQLGEGGEAFAGRDYLTTRARPFLLGAVCTPLYDHLAGDVTQAYPRELGLKHFVRHVLFIKPDVLLVLDDVLCEAERELELRYHLEGTAYGGAGRSYTVAGERTTLQVSLLTPEDIAVQAECFPEPYADGKAGVSDVIRYSRTAPSWRNATALSWAPTGQNPRMVVLRNAGNIWRFLVEDWKVAFDWESGKAVIEP